MTPWLAGLFVILAVLPGTPDASFADTATVTAIDLSAGVLSQSHCKTTIGCAHHQVDVTATSFRSTATATNLAQHILTLAVRGPFGAAAKKGGPHALELDYELQNPSGQANTVICASAIDKGVPVQRCAGGLKRTGVLTVPLSSDVADAIYLHFAAMPLSTGSSFAVKHPRLVRAKAAGGPNAVARPDAVDLANGRLRQPGCQVPVGCAHPDVTLGPDLFASVTAGGNPPPPSDNPNAPFAHVARRLSLGIPVSDTGRGPRALEFDYAIDGSNGVAPGRIRVWTTAGGRLLESAVAGLGKGRGSLAIPPGSPRVDRVTITFEPAAGTAGRFEVSGVTFGNGHPASDHVTPSEWPVTCETCDPPASRLDPCGALLETFYVESADGREGRGIRCVSPDLQSWYGEGWWNDPDYGRYRHLGYFTRTSDLGLPSEAVAVDFGMPRRLAVDGAERLVEYGTPGVQRVAVELRSGTQLRVFTPGGGWNEIWTFVPKGDLLPNFYGSVAWDGSCGGNGLVGWTEDPIDGLHNHQPRCAIPVDLDLTHDPAHAAVPLVWYGLGYLEQRYVYPLEVPLQGAHLGWQTVPAAPSSPVMVASAADRCVIEHESGCHAFDDIQINVLAEGAPGWATAGDRGPGLYVFGPGTWRSGSGLRWMRSDGLPPGASLPEPTPVCLDPGDCP